MNPFTLLGLILVWFEWRKLKEINEDIRWNRESMKRPSTYQEPAIFDPHTSDPAGMPARTLDEQEAAVRRTRETTEAEEAKRQRDIKTTPIKRPKKPKEPTWQELESFAPSDNITAVGPGRESSDPAGDARRKAENAQAAHYKVWLAEQEKKWSAIPTTPKAAPKPAKLIDERPEWQRLMD